MREKFKQYVNTLATIKMDDNKEKILVLKKKYRPDVGGGGNDIRARSEPPNSPGSQVSDTTDGNMSSRVKSDGNLSSGSAFRLSASSSTLATNDTQSLGSAMSSSSLSSASAEPDDANASVISVKERAKHLNRMESESEIQKMSSSNLGAVRKKEGRKNRDADGDDSSTSSSYEPLGPLERDWLVKCSSSDYHLMNELLSKNPKLVSVKDYTSGYTALHWAALHGRIEVIKMLMSKPGVHVNQRTNGGYTPLHLAAIQGHEAVIEILVNAFKADPNLRDYSGKKAKQYLRNSASTRAQQLLVSSRLSSKSVGSDDTDSGFARNSGNRRSNRDSAIRSLIRASTGAMKQTVIRSGWGSTEEINSGNTTPSPRNSAEPSPVIRRRKGSFKNNDGDLMPPPQSGGPFRSKRSTKHSISKESLHSEEKQKSMSKKQVPRSESEPNLGEALQPSKTTFI